MTAVGIMASAVVSGGELLLSDPCDNFTFAPWTVGGSTSVTASGQTGNGFNFPAGSTNNVTYSIASLKQTDTLTVGFHIKFLSWSATQTTYAEFKSDSGATSHTSLKVGNTGAMSIFRGGSQMALSAAGLVTLDVWNLVEATVKLHDTLGSAILRLNGSPVASFAGDTKNAGTKTVFDTVLFAGASLGMAHVMDNIYIRNGL